MPSLVSKPQDYTTVEGEYASFSCLFNGTIPPQHPFSALVSYWTIDYGSTQQQINDNSTDNHYVAVYQTCLNEKLSCCQFISKLMVHNVTVMLNNATVKCFAFVQQSNETVKTYGVKNYYVTDEAKLSEYVL